MVPIGRGNALSQHEVPTQVSSKRQLSERGCGRCCQIQAGSQLSFHCAEITDQQGQEGANQDCCQKFLKPLP